LILLLGFLDSRGLKLNRGIAKRAHSGKFGVREKKTGPWKQNRICMEMAGQMAGHGIGARDAAGIVGRGGRWRDRPTWTTRAKKVDLLYLPTKILNLPTAPLFHMNSHKCPTNASHYG
jgi:hypothetical protein